MPHLLSDAFLSVPMANSVIMQWKQVFPSELAEADRNSDHWTAESLLLFGPDSPGDSFWLGHKLSFHCADDKICSVQCSLMYSEGVYTPIYVQIFFNPRECTVGSTGISEPLEQREEEHFEGTIPAVLPGQRSCPPRTGSKSRLKNSHHVPSTLILSDPTPLPRKYIKMYNFPSWIQFFFPVEMGFLKWISAK